MATTTKATPADIRAWAQSKKLGVGARGRLSAEVVSAYKKAHRASK